MGVDSTGAAVVRVELVNWYSSADVYGQVVRLREGKPVYSVASWKQDGVFPFKPKKFENALLVAADVGTPMLKVPFARLPRLDTDMFRLFKLWECKVAAENGRLSNRRCNWCMSDNFDDARQCPLCMLSFHPLCAQLFATRPDGHVWPALSPHFEMPCDVSLVCGMCAEWLHSCHI